MSKLDSYDWRGLPPDLVEWLNDCTDIINLNMYEAKAFPTPPTSSTAGTQGWFGIAKDGSSWFLYFYTDGTDKWQKVQLSAL
jgi:hypothetical protein